MRGLHVLLATAAMLAGTPVAAQSGDDLVVMRRALAPPRIEDAPSRQKGDWDPQPWRYADSAPACTDHARRVRDVPCKVLGNPADPSKCQATKPAVEDFSEGRYDSCSHSWQISSTGNWSSTCSDTATRSQTFSCVRSGGDSTAAPAPEAKCTGTRPPSISDPTIVVTGCSWRWVYGAYSNWSSSCSNSAVKTRTATCTRSDGTPATDKAVADDECIIRSIAKETLQIGPQKVTTDCTGMLKNGGFEQQKTNWTFSAGARINNTNSTDSATALYSGAYSAYMGEAQGDYVEQTIPTVPGASYTVTAWVWQYGTGFVTIVVKGSILAGTANGNNGNGKWFQRTATFVASASTTTIRFGHGNSYPGYMYLDDVIVAQTPTN